MNHFDSLDLVGIASIIAQKKASAREVVSWSLNRMASIGQAFNAVYRNDGERAMARALALDAQRSRGEHCGSLHGVPLAHKDLLGVAGLERHVGSLILRGRVATETAWALSELDQAGQVNVGSLHMCEFALSPTGFNGHYGHGHNPWNPAYVCGGSSSGSGIAVATRMVFGSLGSDTGGSIRHPAAMCGVTGLKPTARRVSVAGVFPLSHTLDCVGPLAQSARDCARLLTLISRPNPDDEWCTARPNQDYEQGLDGDLRGLRIGVPDAYYRDDLDAEVAAALQASLDVLRARGAVLVAVPTPDMQLINAMTALVLTCEAAALHTNWLQTRPQDYAEQVRLRIEPGFLHSAVEYINALNLRAALTQNYLQTCFSGCDLIHIPTLTVQTPTIEATTTGDAQAVLKSIGHITHANRAINYLGLPAISVPAGFSSIGMPLAFQLVGRPFEEDLILKVADAYQRETDWHQRRPPV